MKNGVFLKSEPAAIDHALKSDEIRAPFLKSESPAIDHFLKSEESISVDTNVHLVPLLRQALIKLATTEYHSTVLDLDEFTRDFNQRTPEFKKTLGSVAVGNEARKLKIVGWRENAKFEGGDQNECGLKENTKDLPFKSIVVTEEEAAKWLEEGGY